MPLKEPRCEAGFFYAIRYFYRLKEDMPALQIRCKRQIWLEVGLYSACKP